MKVDSKLVEQLLTKHYVTEIRQGIQAYICKCGRPCVGYGGWAYHVTEVIKAKATSMKDEMYL